MPGVPPLRYKFQLSDITSLASNGAVVAYARRVRFFTLDSH